MTQLLSPRDVAEILRVDVHTVYRLLRTKQLPAIKVGTQWRIESQDLSDWALRNRAEIDYELRAKWMGQP